MRKFDEKKALATVFANTKRKRRTADLLFVAEAFEYLVKHYGSQRAVADKVNLSPEIVREFRKILSLAPAVQEMIRNREIDRLDVAYRLSKIRDPALQLKAASKLRELDSKDIRDIERLVSGTGLSVADSKKEVLESKLKDLHVFILDFEEPDFELIAERARKRRVAPERLLRDMILQWLRAPGDGRQTKE